KKKPHPRKLSTKSEFLFALACHRVTIPSSNQITSRSSRLLECREDAIMNPSSRPQRSLPEGQAARLNPLCDQFEAQLKAGATPRVEDFLSKVADSDRSALERELRQLERYYGGSRSGPTPPNAGADRNLLLGILAYQNAFITKDQLLA